jgi:DNA methylase
VKIRDRIKELRRVKAADLAPNPMNWRTHPKEQQDALKGLLAEIGYAGALLARELEDGSLQLIDGHLRAETTPDQHVPVLVLDVDEAEARKILATHDPLGAMAGRDDELLKMILETVETQSAAVQAMLDGLLPPVVEIPPKPDPGAKNHRGADLRKKWSVDTGQVWQIGRHRLMCGDSLSSSDVERLMDGASIDVTVLDPPFEMNEEWTVHIADPCIVFGQAKHMRMIPPDLWRFERIIDKITGHRSATTQVLHRHAFVCQCGTIKKLPDDKRATLPSIVEGEDRPEHPHQKQVDLLVEHLTHWTPPGQTLFDPFAGSGTSLVAAAKTGRTCYGMELSPEYVAVILERLTSMGLTASRVTDTLAADPDPSTSAPEPALAPTTDENQPLLF